MRRNRVHLSLWGKLMAFIVAPVLLTVTVIQLVTLVSFRRLQIETAAESVRTQAFSIARSYKEMYGEVIQGINLITIDEELQDLIVRAEPDTEAWLNDNRALRSLIVEKTVLNEGIEAIYLYDQAGRMRTFWHRNYRLGSTVPLYPEMPTDWTLPSGRVTSRMDGERLLFVRRINSMTNLSLTGYCLVIYDRSAFAAQLDWNGLGILLDEREELISENCDTPEEARLLAQACTQDAGRLSVPGVGEVLYAQVRSQPEGWRTLALVRISDVTQPSTLLQRTVIAVSLFALFLAAGICLLTARRWFVEPIRRIRRTLSQAEQGDYAQRVGLRTGDELEALGDSVDTMLAQTDSLINQGLKNDLLQRESQLAALQAQVNPHLLHNALECINWLAEFDRKQEIRQVTLSLSRLMQSLTNAPRSVPLREELDYTRSFLTIYDILLGKRLTYEINLYTSAEIMVPRLTIQPLVENAVIHGIKPSLQPGHIDVSVSDSGEGILISVFNDGVAMTPEKTAAISAFAQGKGGGEGLGVGLRNVIRRLRLVYGDRAVLRCRSDPAWGTVFDVTLPVTKEEREEAAHVEDPDRG